MTASSAQVGLGRRSLDGCSDVASAVVSCGPLRGREATTASSAQVGAGPEVFRSGLWRTGRGGETGDRGCGDRGQGAVICVAGVQAIQRRGCNHRQRTSRRPACHLQPRSACSATDSQRPGARHLLLGEPYSRPFGFFSVLHSLNSYVKHLHACLPAAQPPAFAAAGWPHAPPVPSMPRS